MKTRLLFLILVLMLGLRAQAEKLNSETQNQVIDRIDRILSQMESKDSSWVPTQIRLADLLAERARLRFMNEMESNCQTCQGSKQDRSRALKIYESILERTKMPTRGVVLFQMGHLYEMDGKFEKAQSLYESLVAAGPQKATAEMYARGLTSLADLHFQKARFQKSLELYEKSLKLNETSQKGLIHYRLAWCEFNLGRLNKAIQRLESLASNSSLLVKETEQGPVADPGFQTDVMRDLAAFYARKPITEKELSRYSSLIPQGQRKELLFHFADEADRVGQKPAASKIYQAYLATPGLTREEKVEGLILLSQVSYDKGDVTQSLRSFALASKGLDTRHCDKDEKCVELQKRMKRFVTELHRLRKAKVDLEVLQAYEIYSKTFPQDVEMGILGAQVAIELKQFSKAFEMYGSAADLAKDGKLQETALLGQIESAELSKVPALRLMAYQHYLKLSPDGSKNFEARYQLAQLSYEAKDWDKAADQFHGLALDKSGPADLRKKSADLALDALAVKKNDALIEKWAIEFSRLFPSSEAEFEGIARKAIANQVVVTANSEASSKSELREALTKLNQVSLKFASNSEKIQHHKNALVIAHKIEDGAAIAASTAALLAVKGLLASDREKALADQVGYFEKKLKFAQAYETAKKMNFPSLSKAEKELRLGTLADLAGLKPQRHYEAALKSGLKGTSELSVRIRLIALSSSPARELNRHQTALSRSPDLFNETLLNVFLRQGHGRGLEKSMRNSNLAAVRLIRKQDYLKAHSRIEASLADLHLDNRSDRKLQASIQLRRAQLNKADKSLSEALQLRDLTAQVVALTTIEKENERFVQELMALPTPKGLKPKEIKIYEVMLRQQAKPYVAKSVAARLKLAEIWRSEEINHMIERYQLARKEMRPYFGKDIEVLAARAPTSIDQSRLKSALREPMPSPHELFAAREDVAAQPDNARSIEKLKILETKIGHPLMPIYLNARLEQIQKEKRQ